jgi:hypothetical protein
MVRRQKAAKRPKPKTVLRLPDLEQSKTAVLNSFPAPSSQVSYGHAIDDEFIGWNCSEPSIGGQPNTCPTVSVFSWNKVTWLPPPSTCDWQRSGDSHTKLRILAS